MISPVFVCEPSDVPSNKGYISPSVAESFVSGLPSADRTAYNDQIRVQPVYG